MSDVTRQPGGSPAERDAQTPDARGETALGTGPASGTHAGHRAGPADIDPAPGARTGHDAGPAGGATSPAPGARADHGVGTRDDVTPGLRTDATGTGTRTGTGNATGAGTRAEGAAGTHGLLPHEECDRLGQRLQHAVAEFVDAPRASVEEADRVLEELAARFADAVAHRRRTLRTSWQETGEQTRATSTDTEQLRLALRDYRELADRLMHV
ncbi:hypothetical protein [Streptomyces flaveolus]|uniref:hypothetical protein n=1 Tax=Streptomyces flaveolus TaxID=67297 RepID=UPI001670099A|nr:hypothetical protein [Streptomyces flaveolus]GGQ45648.1 hypothetical protein GCM10010216_02170 [Streptomyces flaveolus]